MSYNRGDVVLVLFPASDSLTAKRRPALVIQAEGLGTQLSQTIVALISSNMSRSGPTFRVAVPLNSALSKGAGLRSDSTIMLDNLATVHNRTIDRKIGALCDMSAVNSSLRTALAL